MKKILLTTVIILIGINITSAQVGIGTEIPEVSAALEVKSTSQGFLPPRMSEDDRDKISSPATGLMIWCTNCSSYGELQVFNGMVWTNLTGGTAIGQNEIINPKTGQIWMDRNLGATQVATSSTDYLAYGDFYQWGRAADGHQTIVWTSADGSDGTEQNNETSNPSSLSTPGRDFITVSDNWYTGTDPNPDNLWKEDGNGVNNPCPSGYRVPTAAEWEAELAAGKITDPQSAFEILKLPVAGYRRNVSGTVFIVKGGYYWSSTVAGSFASRLRFDSSVVGMGATSRANGYSVRCIKE